MATFMITPKHTIPLRGGNKMEKGVPPIIIPLPYNMGPFESPSNKAKVMEISFVAACGIREIHLLAAW